MKRMKSNPVAIMSDQSATSRPYRAVIDWGAIPSLGLQPNLSHPRPAALGNRESAARLPAGLKAPDVIDRAGGPVKRRIPVPSAL